MSSRASGLHFRHTRNSRFSGGLNFRCRNIDDRSSLWECRSKGSAMLCQSGQHRNKKILNPAGADEPRAGKARGTIKRKATALSQRCCTQHRQRTSHPMACMEHSFFADAWCRPKVLTLASRKKQGPEWWAKRRCRPQRAVIL